MVMDIPPINSDRLSSVVTSDINENWQNNYFRLTGLSDSSIPWAKKIHSNIINQTLCATLSYNNEIVACGLCVIENDYAGLYDIFVSAQHRHKGHGQDICASLISNATKYGAKKVYLQVVDANTNAKKLYKKLGFKDMYQYWYRVKGLV
jgi:ribosomal protein S18 acetylase RimI-like enzyme